MLLWALFVELTSSARTEKQASDNSPGEQNKDNGFSTGYQVLRQQRRGKFLAVKQKREWTALGSSE